MTIEQRQAAILRLMNWETSGTDSTLLFGPDGHYLFNDAAKMFYRWPSLDALALVEASLSDEVRMHYSSNLSRVLLATYQENSWLISATFTQRLHALCLTLNLEEE